MCGRISWVQDNAGCPRKCLASQPHKQHRIRRRCFCEKGLPLLANFLQPDSSGLPAGFTRPALQRWVRVALILLSALQRAYQIGLSRISEKPAEAGSLGYDLS